MDDIKNALDRLNSRMEIIEAGNHELDRSIEII